MAEEPTKEEGNNSNLEQIVWEDLPPANAQELKRTLNLVGSMLSHLQSIIGKPLNFSFLVRMEEPDGSITHSLLSSLDHTGACVMMAEFACEHLPIDFFDDDEDEEADEALHDLHSGIADKHRETK